MGCMQSISSGKVDLCFVVFCLLGLLFGLFFRAHFTSRSDILIALVWRRRFLTTLLVTSTCSDGCFREKTNCVPPKKRNNFTLSLQLRIMHVVNINLNIQRKVLKEFGFEDSKAMLDAYHMVRVYAPAIAPCVVYGRYDASMANGSVGVGDKIPFDVTLFSVPTDFSTQLADGYYKKSEVALGHYKKRGRPLVLLGMSAS